MPTDGSRRLALDTNQPAASDYCACGHSRGMHQAPRFRQTLHHVWLRSVHRHSRPDQVRNPNPRRCPLKPHSPWLSKTKSRRSRFSTRRSRNPTSTMAHALKHKRHAGFASPTFAASLHSRRSAPTPRGAESRKAMPATAGQRNVVRTNSTTSRSSLNLTTRTYAGQHQQRRRARLDGLSRRRPATRDLDAHRNAVVTPHWTAADHHLGRSRVATNGVPGAAAPLRGACRSAAPGARWPARRKLTGCVRPDRFGRASAKRTAHSPPHAPSGVRQLLGAQARKDGGQRQGASCGCHAGAGRQARPSGPCVFSGLGAPTRQLLPQLDLPHPCCPVAPPKHSRPCPGCGGRTPLRAVAPLPVPSRTTAARPCAPGAKSGQQQKQQQQQQQPTLPSGSRLAAARWQAGQRTAGCRASPCLSHA